MKTSYKNLIFSAWLFLAVGFLMGCGDSDFPQEELVVSDYYPYTADVGMTYEGLGNEYANYTTTVDYISEDRIQIRENNGGTETVRVLEEKDGKLVVIYERPETYYRLDFTDNATTDGEVLLMEPLKKGTSWALADGSIRTITAMDSKVETPAGTYEAMEVTTKDQDGNKSYAYYAKGVGLVKSVASHAGKEITSSLSRKTEQDAWKTSFLLYSYKIKNKTVDSTSKKVIISMNTNDDMAAILTKQFKRGNVFPQNAEILKLSIKEENRILVVDLSNAFSVNMDAGIDKETGILSSLINTVGEEFQVSKVQLRLEGAPYRSKNIKMSEDQYFIPQYTNQARIEISN